MKLSRGLRNSLAVFLVGSSILPLLRSQDYWPFSEYSMFSQRTSERSHHVYAPFGKSRHGRHIRIWGGFGIPPDGFRLSAMWRGILEDPNLHAAAHEALQDFLRRYNLQVDVSEQLEAIQLYRMEWDLSPGAPYAGSPHLVPMSLKVFSP